MKNTKRTPLFRVSLEEYNKMKRSETHAYKTQLEKKYLKFLPHAYESVSGTMLVFPMALSPKKISFRPKWRFWMKPVVRDVVNIMAIKEEDLSETLRFLLK